MTRIGVISDTHGLVRPEALRYLEGSDHIVHAGDIVEPAILQRLAAIAPLTAVRGNNDHGPWAEALVATAALDIGGYRIFVIHDLAQWRPDPDAPADAVISGHSHRPRIEARAGVLFMNPGSAGPRRFTLPISIGEIIVNGKSASARTVVLVP